MFLPKRSCSAVRFAVRFGSVCLSAQAAVTHREQGHMENVDWNISDVGILYMKKWNGLYNDALTGLSLHYRMK